ncbi:hypothetical protein J2X02_000976 [Pseudoxanthomonas japonensis]|uniref:hypothetical protein n=1 Tax=Pseudoxanthomonas japonensis TaxID=69284 RepID=UPI0028613205|nr:hypothetical protein [Pseudoxanthomonas japonensis]MDR7068159.1 hypothetical protein [Pseudoxanthomonas japonensis]
MTTNVLDHHNRKVTSDSRWSITAGRQLIFVDNSGFEKIAERPLAVMICAGDAKLIDEWKRWFTTPIPANELPPTDRIELDGSFHEIYVTIIKKPEYAVVFSSGDYKQLEHRASFTGSGADFAMACYAINGCSEKCVDSASAQDPRTGGDVKYVDFQTMTSNVNGPYVSMQELEQMFSDRGTVMDLDTKQTSPISAMNKTEIAKALEAGRASIAAPTGRAPRAWTMEEKVAVSDAMRAIVEQEKAANA